MSVLKYSPRNLCSNVAFLKEIGIGVSGPEKCGERVHREDTGVDAGGSSIGSQCLKRARRTITQQEVTVLFDQINKLEIEATRFLHQRSWNYRNGDTRMNPVMLD